MAEETSAAENFAFTRSHHEGGKFSGLRQAEFVDFWLTWLDKEALFVEVNDQWITHKIDEAIAAIGENSLWVIDAV